MSSGDIELIERGNIQLAMEESNKQHERERASDKDENDVCHHHESRTASTLSQINNLMNNVKLLVVPLSFIALFLYVIYTVISGKASGQKSEDIAKEVFEIFINFTRNNIHALPLKTDLTTPNYAQ
jgi:hypothetical protein